MNAGVRRFTSIKKMANLHTLKKKLIEGLQVCCIVMVDIINPSAKNMNNLSVEEVADKYINILLEKEVGAKNMNHLSEEAVDQLKNLFDYMNEFKEKFFDILKENFSATHKEQTPEIEKKLTNLLINSFFKEETSDLTDPEFNVTLDNTLCYFFQQYLPKIVDKFCKLCLSMRPEELHFVFQELFKGLYSC